MWKLRSQIGYGILPSIIIFYILQLYYVCSVILTDYISYILSLIVFSIVFAFSLYGLKKHINAITILHYVGLKYISRVERIATVSLYFLFMSSLFYIIQPKFFEVFSVYFIASVLLFSIMLMEFLIYKYKLFVTFIRITPRLYLDLIHKKIHTKSDIASYDVAGHYVEDLSLSKVDMVKDIFYHPKYHRDYLDKKIENISFEYNDDTSFVNLKAYDVDGNLIWDENFDYDPKEIDEHFIELFVEIIMDIENV